MLIIAGSIMGSFYLGDSLAERLYFISLTGMGMLTTVGVVVSMDTYGPVSDNAQGDRGDVGGEFEGRRPRSWAAWTPSGTRRKRSAKGLAIATAVLAATSLFGSFEEALRVAGLDVQSFNIAEFPTSSSGCCWGVGRVPVLLARDPRGRARHRAGRGGGRNQFRDEIMDFTEKPDYERVVDICTRTSLRG